MRYFILAFACKYIFLFKMFRNLIILKSKVIYVLIFISKICKKKLCKLISLKKVNSLLREAKEVERKLKIMHRIRIELGCERNELTLPRVLFCQEKKKKETTKITILRAINIKRDESGKEMKKYLPVYWCIRFLLVPNNQVQLVPQERRFHVAR